VKLGSLAKSHEKQQRKKQWFWNHVAFFEKELFSLSVKIRLTDFYWWWKQSMNVSTDKQTSLSKRPTWLNLSLYFSRCCFSFAYHVCFTAPGNLVNPVKVVNVFRKLYLGIAISQCYIVFLGDKKRYSSHAKVTNFTWLKVWPNIHTDCPAAWLNCKSVS